MTDAFAHDCDWWLYHMEDRTGEQIGGVIGRTAAAVQVHASTMRRHAKMEGEMGASAWTLLRKALCEYLRGDDVQKMLSDTMIGAIKRELGYEPVEELSETERGDGGYGSTGVK